MDMTKKHQLYDVVMVVGVCVTCIGCHMPPDLSDTRLYLLGPQYLSSPSGNLVGETQVPDQQPQCSQISCDYLHTRRWYVKPTVEAPCMCRHAYNWHALLLALYVHTCKKKT